LKGPDGRISFAAVVSGQAAHPKVEIDTAELQSKARSAGEAAAREKLKGLLPGAGSQSLKDSLDSLGSGSNKELEDKATNALRDLLKGVGKKKKGGE